MSKKHPVIAVTGSSGAGTSTVKKVFDNIFKRLEVNPAIIEGDSFHRYNRKQMKRVMEEEKSKGNNSFSHFGPEANYFDKIEKTFKSYGEKGFCLRRYYVHNEDQAKSLGKKPGEFTEWQETERNSDFLFYEGLHGGVKHEKINVAKYVDLLIGIVPVVNLEWIQKIHRDKDARGYSIEETVGIIHRRMWDYINYITPQFSRTHINFQRVPMVDTSNPFIARDIPTLDESFVVVRFKKQNLCDFVYMQNMINGSFMSRPNTIVIPGAKMAFAMEIILRQQLKKILSSKVT